MKSLENKHIVGFSRRGIPGGICGDPQRISGAISGRIPGELPRKILKVIFVAIFLEVSLGLFLDEIFEEFLKQFFCKMEDFLVESLEEFLVKSLKKKLSYKSWRNLERTPEKSNSCKYPWRNF